jgi:hypothetical protein
MWLGPCLLLLSPRVRVVMRLQEIAVWTSFIVRDPCVLVCSVPRRVPQGTGPAETSIKKAFNFLDYNNTGVVDFLNIKVGLERLKLHPKVKVLEEDWRDITNDGDLCGDDQVMLYVQ